MNLSMLKLNLCLPSLIYLVLSIALVVYNINRSLFDILFFLFMTYVINEMCKRKYTMVAWVLALFPFMGYVFHAIL